MKYFLFFIFVTIFSLQTFALEFKDCGSVTGTFSKVEVSNCDTEKSHCVLKRNSNVSISIDFTPTKDEIQNVTAVVHGTVLSIEMPFPLPQKNGCESGLLCPLKIGQKYEYAATLPVLKSYPKVKVGVKWELKDEAGDNIVCVEIPAKIE